MTRQNPARIICARRGAHPVCGSMSGLDASSSFSCKAAPGVNFANPSVAFKKHGWQPAIPAPGRKRNEDTGWREEAYGAPRNDSKVSPRDMNAQYSGMPVRQPPLVLRVWMAPYEDEGGDLHDQSYFYTMVHSGKWMIEANRTRSTVSSSRSIHESTDSEQSGTSRPTRKYNLSSKSSSTAFWSKNPTPSN